MKTRNGFVSNSSTSSFIVNYKQGTLGSKRKNAKVILNKRDVKKLKEFGFKETSVKDPFHYNMQEFDEGNKICEKNAKTFGSSLAYWIVCNENDVFYFLLKNNIPFTATEHYEDYFLFYEKDSSHFYKISNIGMQVATDLRHNATSPSKIKKRFEDNWFQKISVKKWLKKEEKWQKEYEQILKEEANENT